MPAWHSEYNAEQIEAFEDALARWKEYRELSEHVWRKGKNTSEARRIIREFEMNARGVIALLAETYDKGGVREIRGPEPLSWAPGDITLSRTGGAVTINQCTDFSRVEVTQHGRPLPGAKPKMPRVNFQVKMDKSTDHDWMILSTTRQDKKSCVA